jgi:Ca2+-binding RTX toxin-like protein
MATTFNTTPIIPTISTAVDEQGDTPTGSDSALVDDNDADDSLMGGTGSDRLLGGSGDDSLMGGTGDDRLLGGSGADSLMGGTGNDRLLGGSGDDSLMGGTGNDRLLGGSGADWLMGGTGNDRLLGGSGADWLNGGSGADIFIFRNLSDSTLAASDIIEDFTRGIDKINLSRIDSNTALADDQAFLFAGQSGSAVANSVNWFESDGNTVVQVDVDGNPGADMQLILVGTNLGLTAADFVL